MSTLPLSRRGFLKNAILTGGAGALASGCKPGESSRSQPAIKWRVQTAWDVGTVGFSAFSRFCANIKGLTDGQLEFEPLPPGTVAGTFQLFDAVRDGKCEAMNAFPYYWASKVPMTAFLGSYPMALDRPDQWETWYYELGGLQLARRAFEANGLFFVGPIQHDLNLIHSNVPIRSFEDFKGKKIRFPGGLIADVFTGCGVSTVVLPGAEVYGALSKGDIEAADYAGPAQNLKLGFGDVARYIIMGPRTTPCIHQPVDLMDLTVSLARWRELGPRLQQLVTVAVRQYSWDHYAVIQRENIDAWGKFAQKGVEIIRLTEADVEKFRRVAIATWFKWAKKDPMAREAFASQLRYMRSPCVGYITDDMLVDKDGQKLEL